MLFVIVAVAARKAQINVLISFFKELGSIKINHGGKVFSKTLQ